MQEQTPAIHEPAGHVPRRDGRVWAASLVLLVVVIAMAIGGSRPYAVGPKQPLPFSHRVHAGDKQISCMFCHPYADRSQNAGLPGMSTCYLCHERIAPNLEPIANLRHLVETKQVAQWVRVVALADYVHFNHALHIHKGVDCGECHGNVKTMDRITNTHKWNMGFCIDCHHRKGASEDCVTCHY